jgi:predicted nucleic acid-binding protein
MKRIYLDTCSLNRPFDNQKQLRIRLESEAILYTLAKCEAQQWQWISSTALEIEIAQIPDSTRRNRLTLIINGAAEFFRVDRPTVLRAHNLESLGFQSFDALHIACAESAKTDVFLTTDDRLLKVALRHSNEITIPVMNPLVWLDKVEKELYDN